MTFLRENILDGTAPDVIELYESLGRRAEQADFGLLDEDVVVLDTETTGLSFNHDELTQIAAARLRRGVVVDWYTTFVKPTKEISEEITHLTGISNETVADAPAAGEALAGLVEFVGDAPIVAHNANFDRHFVTSLPQGYPLLDNRWIDTVELSRIALPRLKSHRLIDLVRSFGGPLSTHRADEDVAATCVIYRVLLAGCAALPPDLLSYIATMAPEKEWPTSFVFRQLAGLPDSHHHFSLRAMCSDRVRELPGALPRKDADELVGSLKFPSAQAIEEAFSATGLLGEIYPSYETRAPQLAMALAIRNAFEQGENLVVEAGTGVGKSMAYLVTSALFAKENDIAVGVATKTNSLLDQLVFQELPALAAGLSAAFPEMAPLRWAALKGMSHYPCLRRIGRIVDDGPAMRTVGTETLSQAPALAALLSFINQTAFDDIDALKIDYRALPKRSITSRPADCLRRKCPYYGKLCYAHGARRLAESADIMVTNHSLLFCNIAAEGHLLPTSRHWIIDEAHGTEDEAREAFAAELSSEELERLLGRIGSSAGARNLFNRAEKAASNSEEDTYAQFIRLLAKARSRGAAFEEAARRYMAAVKELLFFAPKATRKGGQTYDILPVWINEEVRHSQIFGDLSLVVSDFVEAADSLISESQNVVGFLEGIDEAALAQREIAAATLELREMRDAAELIFFTPSESFVYQGKLHRKKDRQTDVLQALPLAVGGLMNDLLYSQTQSVIYASATLAVGSGFDSFSSAVGLGESEFSQFSALQLESAFDFDNQMTVYVATDMPDPNSADYGRELNRLLSGAHRANGGSMLTLFTNRREMEDSYREVSAELAPDDLRIVCQKWGVSVKGLRDDFVADHSLSLFALKSFWEGFDAPGDTLRGVIIPKLPFARPDDPLNFERAARDDRAWFHHVLPQAVIETKQAAGRLIRKADDAGVLILADNRLVTKGYGKTFLKSLQSKNVKLATIDEIVAALSNGAGPAAPADAAEPASPSAAALSQKDS